MRQAVKSNYWNLFLKPLDTNSWVTFIATTVTLVLGSQLLPFLCRFLGIHAKIAMKFSKFLVFLAWMGFVITFCFYQGVLTMFFSTKVDIPFESIKDVIKSYPKWKLMIRSGSETYYTPQVKSRDRDFLAFFSRIQNKPDETLFSDIEDVITLHAKDAVVVSIQQSIIDVHTKYGNPEQHNKLEIFQRGPFEPYGMIVTKNSPFGLILKYAAEIMLERGVFRHLKLKWTPRDTEYKPSNEVESLNMMHLSVAFASFSMLIGISVVIFIGEIGSKKRNQYFPELKEKWNSECSKWSSAITQSDAEENSPRNANQHEQSYVMELK